MNKRVESFDHTMSPSFPFRKALLLEDEVALGTALELALRRLGIPVDRVTHLGKARERFRSETYDFALLDRNLPDGDGLEFCRELRAQGFQGAILILTAKGDTLDRIEGLNAGSDDYLPKPFSWQELEARIHALARRWKNAISSFNSPEISPENSPENYQNFEASPLWGMKRETLTVIGQKGAVTLTPLEFKLVDYLLQHPERIITREELLSEVWGYTGTTHTRTVDYFMTRVRKHLEEIPEQPQHFLSVRGAGYRFKR
jgi:two-component system alkaline phosphatase synthesis response regulator PhoP